MNIAVVEPFYGGSHKAWLDGLVMHSTHQIDTFTLKGKYWKWRMTGGAISLVRQIIENEQIYDVFLVTDFLDVALFKSLLPPNMRNVPIAMYFHENQLMYPENANSSDPQEWDRHYAFMNYSSALVADQLLFSSEYQQNGFFEALDKFLRVMPDHRELENIEVLKDRSSTLPVGLELPPSTGKNRSFSGKHTLLWNHRHEYDKGPDAFFNVLMKLSKEGHDFNLVVLGETYAREPEIFNSAHSDLSRHIIQWGEVNKDEYWHWLGEATILPVTSHHDFFGISVLEAAAMGVKPLLPKRLVYPDHFGKRSDLFYTDLYLALKKELSLPYSFDPKIEDIARSYEWDKIISRYDGVLAQLKP